MFGLFLTSDGHGVCGAEASKFVKALLPLSLHNEFKTMEEETELKQTIKDLFAYIDKKLMSEEKIDTKYSGTTSCSLIVKQDKVISINLGDSRAVMGSQVQGKWRARVLTKDHKPDDDEEKKRIIKQNGRVFHYKDEEGNDIGPARVWIKDYDVPGLAMSRSFGDAVASSVGVLSEPEVDEHEFLEEDKFVVLATDGVWEFMENSEVIEIVGKYYERKDPKGAAEELIKVTRKKWIEVFR